MLKSTNSNGQTAKPIFWGYLFCAVLTAILVLGLLAVVLISLVDINFLSETSCKKHEASYFLDEFTFCFYGKDWDESTYLSAVSGFYSTLIAVLVAVQAIVSGLAFMVVRSSSKRAIEDEVESQLPIYFGRVKAVEEVEKIVKGISEDTVKSAVTQGTAELEQELEAFKQLFYGLQGDYEELVAKLKILEILKDDEETDEDHGGPITE